MARHLRSQMALPEVLLWQQLQQRPGSYLFRNQHPLGRYALDFCCIRARLAIEVDGAHHAMGNRPERDAARDAWVLKKGFHTLRIAASDVLNNMEGVVIAIVEACKARAKPTPPRNGEVARSDGGVASRANSLPVESGPSVSTSCCHLPVPGRTS